MDLTNSRTFCPFLGSDNEVIVRISKNYCLKYVGKKLERPSRYVNIFENKTFEKFIISIYLMLKILK